MNKVDLLLCDPDWAFDDGIGKRGSASMYGSTTVDELAALAPLLDRILAPDCVIAMWFAASMPGAALELMRQWGFAQKQIWVWAKKTKHGKDHFGMGRYARASKECLYLGVRGSPKVQDRSIRDRFEATLPVWEDGSGLYDHLWGQTCRNKGLPADTPITTGRPVHSAKPEILVDRLEQMFAPCNPMEMHARRDRSRARPEGVRWQLLGNDLPEDNPAQGLWRGQFSDTLERMHAAISLSGATWTGTTSETLQRADEAGTNSSGHAVLPLRGDADRPSGARSDSSCVGDHPTGSADQPAVESRGLEEDDPEHEESPDPHCSRRVATPEGVGSRGTRLGATSPTPPPATPEGVADIIERLRQVPPTTRTCATWMGGVYWSAGALIRILAFDHAEWTKRKNKPRYRVHVESWRMAHQLLGEEHAKEPEGATKASVEAETETRSPSPGQALDEAASGETCDDHRDTREGLPVLLRGPREPRHSRRRTGRMMHIKHLRSPTLKGGFDVELGEKTLLVGPNAAGKTAVIQGAEALLSGAVSDLAGKDLVKMPVELLALVGEDEDLLVEGEMSNGTSASFKITRKGPGKASRPVHALPDGVNGNAVPMRGLMDVVRASPERARRFFLEAACGTVSHKDVLERLPGTLHGMYARAAGAKGETEQAAYMYIFDGKLRADALDTLLRVKDRAKKEASKLKKEAAANTQAYERQPVAVAPPTGAQIQDVQDRLTALQTQRLAVAQLVVDAKAVAARNEERARISDTHRQLFQAVPTVRQQLVEAQAKADSAAVLVKRLEAAPQPVDNRPRAAAAALLLEAMVAKDATMCGLCGETHSAGHFRERAKLILGALRTAAETPPASNAALVEAQRQAGYWTAFVANYTEQLAKAQAQLDALKAQFQALGNIEEVPLVPDTVELDEKIATQRAWLDDANRALASKATLSTLRDAAAMCEERRVKWMALSQACDQVISELLETAIDTFVERVQAYLPEEDVFALRVHDGAREVLQYGLMRERVAPDGATSHHLDTALSGAEWARVTAAIACALADGSEMTLIVPEERAYDAKTLRSVMTALTKAPGQVIMQSPIRPHRGKVKGWTILEIGGDDAE